MHAVRVNLQRENHSGKWFSDPELQLNREECDAEPGVTPVGCVGARKRPKVSEMTLTVGSPHNYTMTAIQ